MIPHFPKIDLIIKYTISHNMDIRHNEENNYFFY